MLTRSNIKLMLVIAKIKVLKSTLLTMALRDRPTYASSIPILQEASANSTSSILVSSNFITKHLHEERNTANNGMVIDPFIWIALLVN